MIFLDIDGVLNDDYTYVKDRTPNGFCGIDDDKVLLLKEIVDRTGAEIVLDSSWKDFWQTKEDKDGIYLDEKLLKAGLKILDKTTDNWYNRGEGVCKYLISKGKEVESFVLLDDETFDDFKDFGLLENLVLTNGKYGIRQEDVEKAIDILGEIKTDE